MKCPICWRWGCFVSLELFFSCGGPSFEAVSSSFDSATALSAEGKDWDSGELEAASESGILGEGANPKKVDAGADPSEAASFALICNTPEEFQKECVLWWKRELPESGTCWDRCGMCEGIGAVCIRKE